jgi:uncharacterized protein (DUF362 family)
MDRREFLKKAALATLAATSAPLWTGISESKERGEEGPLKSRVVVAHHLRVTDQEGRIDEETLELLLREAVQSFTGKQDERDAWVSLLHPFRTSDTFGLRVNCISAKCPSRPELVEAIAKALNRIGIPSEQIIAWDRTGWEMEKAGYTLNKGNRGVQYFGLDAEGVGFDEEATVEIPSASLTLPLGRLLSATCDHIINIPVIKDHSTSGFTFSLKSAYAYLPLFKAIPRIDTRVRAMHTHHCDPQIAELNRNPIIRKKNRVVIGDALLGLYDKGPIAPANWRPNRLIIGKDMVATDTVALAILEAKRGEVGLPSIREKAGHIHSAAQYGLGQEDPARIEMIELNLG